MPVSALRLVQFGQETTWGTYTTATSRLMLVTDASLRIEQQSRVLTHLGDVAPGPTAVMESVSGVGHVEQEMSYQDILYWGNAMMGVTTTPTVTWPYVWTFTAPTTAQIVPQLFSMDFGAPSASYRMAGALVTGMTISGESPGAWKITADLVGKSIVAGANAAIADRVVNAINMADTNIYMNTWGGSMGATTVAAILIGFELALENGRHLKFFAGGNTPQAWGDELFNGTLRTTLEYTAAAKALVDIMAAAPPVLVQQQIQIMATVGASTSITAIALQCPCTLIEAVELFSDRDGNITVELNWALTKHTTFGSCMKMIVTNGMSTLP